MTDPLATHEVECAYCNGVGRITVPAEVDTTPVYYFGCWRETGHYWIDPSNPGTWSTSKIEKALPEGLRHGRIDGGRCPGAAESLEDRKSDRRTRPEVEGEARLTHIDGWTVLGWWDRSVDIRGASNSNIVAKGTYDFTLMLEIGKRRLPHVMARQHHPLRLVETREA